MRAISVFIFDTGMSTRRCFDPQALRMRVSMSAIGSLMLIGNPMSSRIRWTWRNESESVGPATCLPARLAHARDHALERELAEADTAQAEAAQVGTRTPAPAATIV